VLSAQEGRVARLVAQGMTNQEVARRLYVSPKTVEFHLSNVFTKLGIASRRQLRPGMLEPLRA
jgi:DNA-binding CsgD family transcriptional regulator